MQPPKSWRRRLTLKLDKTSIVGLILCTLLYLAYEQHLSTKYPHRFKQKSSQPTQAPIEKETVATKATKSGSEFPFSQATENSLLEDIVIQTPLVKYSFSQSSGSIKSLELQKILANDKKDSYALIKDLFVLQASTKPEWQQQAFTVKRVDEHSIAFVRQEDEWEIGQVYKIEPNSYGLTISFTWKNLANVSRELDSHIYMFSQENMKKAETSTFQTFSPDITSINHSINKQSEWIALSDFCAPTSTDKIWKHQNIDFWGIDNQYFIKTLIPQTDKSTLSISSLIQPGSLDACTIKAHSIVEQGRIAAGDTASYEFKAWFGPKSITAMKHFDSKLEQAVDLGFFSSISQWLLYCLQLIYNLVGNWGLAIIIFTIILKILFYPLTYQSAASAHRMKKFQPQMNQIKEKYKDNPEKERLELMNFVTKNKVNPAKGCLPMLPTIPVFFAFFRVLSTSVELRHAPFYGWIHDLSISDPYYITPLVFGATMFIQQKITPTPGTDKTQEKIMMMLPLMFTFISLQFPAGMALYMTTNTVVSILQQRWINRKLNATSKVEV
jgi:YidC/Oxa1 family membrane protein insertase